MVRRALALLALVALLPAAAAADDPRGTGAAALSGQWKLVWNTTSYGGALAGGHYVQVLSDGPLHWTDSVRDLRRLGGGPGAFDASPRCEGYADLSADDVAVMRDLGRAMYDLQLPDSGRGLNMAFLELIVSRAGRNYVAGVVNYLPGGANLDPRIKRAHAIFARFACPNPPPTPAARRAP